MEEEKKYEMQDHKGGETQGGGSENENEKQRYKVIARCLWDMGILPNLKGYDYIKEAIALCVVSSEKVQAITKVLYPVIGKKFGTTPSRVERAIRHAIEVAWLRIDLDVVKEVFGNTISAEKGRPTNSEFIAQVVEYIRINYNLDA